MKNQSLIALILAVIVLCCAVVSNIKAADSDVDPTFVSRLVGGLDSEFVGVESIAVQPDGKMLVGGTFKSFASRLQAGIGRANADGSPDYAFNPNANGNVYAVAVQADGKVLIGGEFTQVGGQPRTRLARLNADGTLDAAFGNLNVNARVWTIVLQADGKILIGGAFDGVAGQNQSGVARLNQNGTLDTTFGNPDLGGAGSTVYALAVQPDGKIFVGGDNIFVIGSQYRYFGRLNANGTADASFPDVVGVGDVRKIKIQADGKIMISGSFAFIGPTGNTVNRKAIARLNANGSNDVSFGNVTEISASTIYDFVTLPDGRIIIGGTFTSQSSTRGGLARINSDGTLDASYDPNLDSQVRSLTLQADGKLVVGGYFRFVGGQSRRNFVRLNTNASLDLFPKDITLNHPTSSSRGRVRAITIQPDGKILVGGYFASAVGRTRRGVVRINPDSTIDTTFTDPGITNEVFYGVSAITIQPDGKILVGGDFRTVNGLDRRYLIRLNADGTLDNSFTATLDNTVFSIVVQPDGRILIGGIFGQVDGQSRSRLARLNANGTLDASFNRGSDFAVVYSMILQADGKIIAPGGQSGVQGDLLRYNADGTRDTTFSTPNVSGSSIVKVLRQPDGKILIGGPFSTVNGVARRHVARLNADGTVDATLQSTNNAFGSVGDLALQPDGKIIIAGDFTPVAGNTARRYLARLNADGTYDTAFNPLPDNSVYVVALQADRRILAGGDFQEVGGITQDYITRLLNGNNPFALTTRPAFDFDGDGKADVSVFRPSNGTWYLQQSQNGFTGLQFGAATDKIVPADYDGDGKTDVAVYRSGTWFIQRSQLGFTGVAFGDANDIPASADYDGDGKADLAVFRPSNGIWYMLQSSQGFTGVQFGQTGDKPVAADYDGDGKADVAVFRNGTWFINRSSLGFTGVAFGDAADKAVPADYDGDGKTDIAVFRPSSGTWYLQRSQAGFTGVAFGAGTDQPTPGDYDGDGRADIAVFRPSAGAWYLQRSQAGFTGVPFGASEDQPVPNAFVR